MSDNNGEFRADASRRRFLRGVAMTGGAAVFAAGAGGSWAAQEVAADTPQDLEGKKGYRETDHIRAYYRRADL